MIKNRIYFDNASATKINNNVKKKIIETMNIFGNPSSIHLEGRLAKKKINQAKITISKILNCNFSEIIFTGSGTEANNLAIFGVIEKYKKYGRHIITTKIEHHSVLYLMKKLEKQGFNITYLNVKKNGVIDIKEFENAIKKDTIFISIMYANNEIGTIQPIQKISKIIKKNKINNQFKPIFHTDACQAINYLNIDTKKIDVDLLSFSGSKIYGPKGAGVLYKKSLIKLEPQILGGNQENNLRAGTESLINIIGLSEALKITEKIKKKEVERLIELRNYFIQEIKIKIKKIKINGDLKKRLPNNIHISFFGIEGESLLLLLDEKGISCSTSSACSSLNLETSHVLEALNLPINYIHSSLRFSLGRDSTKKDIDYSIYILKQSVQKLRLFSPSFYEKKYNKKLREV